MQTPNPVERPAWSADTPSKLALDPLAPDPDADWIGIGWLRHLGSVGSIKYLQSAQHTVVVRHQDGAYISIQTRQKSRAELPFKGMENV